jgi:hypothetical protein
MAVNSPAIEILISSLTPHETLLNLTTRLALHPLLARSRNSDMAIGKVSFAQQVRRPVPFVRMGLSQGNATGRFSPPRVSV